MDLIQHIRENVFIAALAGIGIALLLHFVYQYLLRGWLLWRELKAITRKISAIEKGDLQGLRPRLSEVFEKSKLAHAWNEFDETLHDQKRLVNGQHQVVAIRATAPAETFLHVESVIDPVIHTEYFKHLPGIFTGLGIIGTFAGLISGLIAFNPDVDVEALKTSLGVLFGYVKEAFLFSAAAIGVAMLVTLLEKFLYAACTYRLGRLTEALDRLFKAGVGEDYLADLLRSSQDTATQTRQLKESLVEDLKSMLTNLSEAQVGATRQMAADIGQSIEGSLKEPLSHLAETVRQASGQQTTAASNALESLMSAFMAQMKESVGGQLGDMGRLLQQTTQSLSTVEGTLRGLVGDMKAANSEASEELRGAVLSLIDSIALQQREQTSAASRGMQELLAGVDAAVRRIEERQESMFEQMARSLQTVTSAMDTRISTLADSNAQATEATRNAVAALSGMSTEAITGMREGALAMTEAGKAVARTTETVASVLNRLEAVQTWLGTATQKLSESASVLGATGSALATSVRTLDGTSTRLETVAQSAAIEAESRKAMLRDIEALQDQAKMASVEFAALTKATRGELTQAVEDFAGNLTRALSLNLGEYQKQLGSAIQMLSTALQELAEVTADGGR